MKRCPECGREYDNTMMFCLDDGAELLYGPARSEPGAVATGFTSDEPQTAILHSTAAPGEAPTRAQIHTTEQTAILPTGTGDVGTKKSFDKRLLLAPIALAIIILGGFFGYRYFNAADSEQVNSIAVLPFENRSGDADTDYLSDGLADSLIYRLSQLPNLKVSPTSSVMRYKGSATDVANIAKELEVDAVMSGRLSQRGDDLSISVQLIDARTRKLIWAEQYDRKMADLLATQREIATTITQKLQLKLTGEETGIVKKYTDSNEAYQLYLKGRFFWNKRDEENIRKAIEQFKAAAEKDPNFALAFVGLADGHSTLPYYSGEASTAVLPQAKIYATRALEIDGSLAEVHASLGFYYLQSWNWDEAERSLKRAIELNPSYAQAHHWLGLYLETMSRFDEAEISFKRAIELEPLIPIFHHALGEDYLLKGEINAAAAASQRAIELDPNWYMPRFNLALVHLGQGRNAEAIAEAERCVDLSRRQSIPLGILGYIYAKTGSKTNAIKIIDELTERRQNQPSVGLNIARVHAALGKKDEAFDLLESEFQARNQILALYLGRGVYRDLSGDPRYKELVRRVGIPGRENYL